jgi:hypothetical protein
MAMATAPGKQLFMTAFMLYMSGNGLQVSFAVHSCSTTMRCDAMDNCCDGVIQ